jgi:hypothetical protein
MFLFFFFGVGNMWWKFVDRRGSVVPSGWVDLWGVSWMP